MRALPGPIGLGPTRLDPLARRSAFERLARRWRALLPLAALCLLALTALPASAQTFPPLSGRVVDAAQLLDAATEADLTQKLAAFEERSSDQVVVATVPDLQGTDIADYGYRLGRAWGIGWEGEAEGEQRERNPPPSAGEGAPRMRGGRGERRCRLAAVERELSGSVASLSRPSLTRGPPSPAEGRGKVPHS